MIYESNEQMDKYKQELIDKYKHLVKPGKKTIDELTEFLIKKASAIQIDFSSLLDITRKGLIMGITPHIEERNLNLKVDDLNFLVFILPHNGQDSTYYQYPYRPTSIDGYGDDLICIILERNTDYISCNCSRLFLDVVLERGISEYDYDNDTIELLIYLSRIEELENKWY